MSAKELKPELRIKTAAKNDNSWWGKFLRKNADNKKLHKAMISAIKADKEISKENVDELEELIEGIPESMVEEREILEKKFKILQKREERRIDSDLGALLRHYRTLKGMSLSELGEITNVSPSYINRIETGKRSAPSYPIIEKMAEALDISVVDLLGSSREETDEDHGATSFASAIYNKKMYVDDESHTLTKKEKEALVGLIEYIYEADWADDKHKETMEVINKIDHIKEIQKKKKKK